MISEAEYLAKMRTIMEDYHAGKSTVTYPESIKNNVHAQAFYGVLSAVFDEAKEAEVSPDFAAEIAEEITKLWPTTVKSIGPTTKQSTTESRRILMTFFMTMRKNGD